MEPFVGEIRLVGFNFAPRGWALCQGQLLSIASNTTLFSLLGNTYGGDGRTTFALPDLRGRTPVGTGEGPGLPNITQGEVFGSESVTLTLAQLPPHSPQVGVQVCIPAVSASENTTPAPSASSHLGPITAAGRSGDLYTEDTPDTTLAPFNAEVSVEPVGGGQPVAIRNPSLGLNYAIALEGIYPSRE